MKPFLLLMPMSVLLMVASLNALEPALDKTPRMGELAQDFELRTPDGTPVKLSILTEKGPVALIVLRGYPGEQSAVCGRQVADLINKASGFIDAGATVIVVYPGAADKLEVHAKEFMADKMLPTNFRFVIDPDYVFTNKYGLRWDAKNETSYPATFVMNAKGLVTYALVSRTHGGRAKTEEVLKALSIK